MEGFMGKSSINGYKWVIMFYEAEIWGIYGNLWESGKTMENHPSFQ